MASSDIFKISAPWKIEFNGVLGVELKGIPIPPPVADDEDWPVLTVEVEGVDNTTIKPLAPFAGGVVNLIALSTIV